MAKDKHVMTTIPEDQHIALKIKSAKTGKPISEILRELIRDFLGSGKSSDGKQEKS